MLFSIILTIVRLPKQHIRYKFCPAYEFSEPKTCTPISHQQNIHALLRVQKQDKGVEFLDSTFKGVVCVYLIHLVNQPLQTIHSARPNSPLETPHSSTNYSLLYITQHIALSSPENIRTRQKSKIHSSPTQ